MDEELNERWQNAAPLVLTALAQDGSVTDLLTGNQIQAPSASGAEKYKYSAPIVDKALGADGSLYPWVEILAGGGGSSGGTSGPALWGAITGTLANQLDLSAALAARLARQQTYADGSWEMWADESDGGGHWYWSSADATLRFDGANNDPSSPIVWERYCIKGGAANYVTSGGTRIGARDIWAWDGGAVGAGRIRHYYTTNKSNSSFASGDELVTIGSIPSGGGGGLLSKVAIVSADDWEESQSEEDGGLLYEYDISDANVTESSMVLIAPADKDSDAITSTLLCRYAETHDGGVTIYAIEQPTADILLLYTVIQGVG